jgi:hypothetical protein
MDASRKAAWPSKGPTQIFFHPDYTVGFGIAPNLRITLADFTANRESHPALKTFHIQMYLHDIT